MKNNTILRVAITILIVVFFAHQLYSALYKPVVTVSAEHYEHIEGVTVSAAVFRTEKLVTNDTSGTLHFTVSDGERVPKNGVIAQVYGSASASMSVSRIFELERQITDMEQMQSYNDKQAADLDLANTKVENAMNEYVTACSNGDFSAVSESAASLLTCINRRSLITGEQKDFSSQIEVLRTELERVRSSLPAVKANVTTTASGFFLSGTDGYETVYTCENLESITPDFLKEAKPEKTPENVIGKVVSDYEWYLAATVSLDESLKYKQGQSVKLRTKLKSNPILGVTVKQVNISDSGDRAVVIFACNDVNSELSSLRNLSITIVNHTYTGLRIPKKALRVVDDKTGVYIVSGLKIKFVKVKVLHSAKDGYIICEQEKSNSKVLRIYDEVVVKGRKLYDGKIIN